MATLKVRYFVRKARQGRPPRFYWQPSADLIAAGFVTRRLPDDELQAVAAAQGYNAELDQWRRGEPIQGPAGRPREGTFTALVDLYKKDERYTRLAPATRRSYDQALALAEAELGDLAVRTFTRSLLEAFYVREFRRAPAMANATMRVVRRALHLAVVRDWIKVNPAAKPELHGLAPRDRLWPAEARRAFVAAADAMGRASIGTAVVLAGNLAQRQADVLRLHWNQVADDRFRLRQAKTGKWVDVPASAELKARLAALARHAGPIVLSEETGGAYKADNFRHLFAEVREFAAVGQPDADGWPRVAWVPELLDLWFMDLRRTGIVELGEAGATEAEIAAVSGHDIERTRRILETYLPRTGAMATAAIAKLDAHRARKPEAR